MSPWQKYQMKFRNCRVNLEVAVLFVDRTKRRIGAAELLHESELVKTLIIKEKCI